MMEKKEVQRSEASAVSGVQVRPAGHKKTGDVNFESRHSLVKRSLVGFTARNVRIGSAVQKELHNALIPDKDGVVLQIGTLRFLSLKISLLVSQFLPTESSENCPECWDQLPSPRAL